LQGVTDGMQAGERRDKETERVRERKGVEKGN
jgi:hypothetical protein